MAMKPIVGMAAAQAAKQKLALKPNGTFAPAKVPQPPIGRRPTMEEMNPVMKPPVGIGMPPPSMGGGKPPFIPGEGGRGLPPPNTGGMIATPPPGMGGRLGAVGGAPAMGGSQMGGRLGAPSGMPAGMLGSGGPKMNPYTLPPANAQAAYSAPPLQANLKSMAGLGTAAKGMKKGGPVKASKMGAVKQSKPSMGSASKRGDGIAQRGKTKGRIV